MLTKRFLIKEQIIVVLFCILAASIVGSIQTALIIKKCGRKNG